MPKLALMTTRRSGGAPRQRRLLMVLGLATFVLVFGYLYTLEDRLFGNETLMSLASDLALDVATTDIQSREEEEEEEKNDPASVVALRRKSVANEGEPKPHNATSALPMHPSPHNHKEQLLLQQAASQSLDEPEQQPQGGEQEQSPQQTSPDSASSAEEQGEDAQPALKEDKAEEKAANDTANSHHDPDAHNNSQPASSSNNNNTTLDDVTDLLQNEAAIYASPEAYQAAFARVTVADPNRKTIAYAAGSFYSGFCNELMAFTSFIMQAHNDNFTQVLLSHFRWKDLFGTNRKVAHEHLFDVVHWNLHYARRRQLSGGRPPLPRLVVHDASMIDWDPQTKQWRIHFHNATKPYATGFQTKLFTQYKRYNKQFGSDNDNNATRHPSELAMMQGAFRPHPDLQRMIDDAQMAMVSDSGDVRNNSSNDNNTSVAEAARVLKRHDGPQKSGYMCLHARIEPDMQKHPVCRDRKVTSLQHIVQALYRQYPDQPPANRLLIVLYRKLLEQENATENPLAGENLQLLNQLRRDGLWNGTVKVYEAGARKLDEESWFGKYAPSISGSIFNYNLAINADVFIGTPVSSYSTHVIATRYHRNRTQNFFYLPDGLQAIDANHEPPGFRC